MPLPLKNAFNVRDLGVYCNKDGKKLNEHRFLRSDSLSNLDEEDWQMLKEYGVVAIVDLRSSMEIEKAPFSVPESMEYHSIPLFDNIQSNDGSQKVPDSLFQLYCGLLTNSKAEIQKVFQTFLQYESGCCLFNCSAGKDRTGVIAMLLLGLAGVEEDTIVADYSQSAENMKPVFEGQIRAMEAAGYGTLAFLLQSEPKEMQQTLVFIRETYGSINGYLAQILSEEETGMLRERLVAAV